jgi:hypothetical protein
MNSPDLAADGWKVDAARYTEVADRPEFEPCADIHQIINHPEAAWGSLLALLDALDDQLLHYAGAGPLESIVIRHAARFIDRIEERAHNDERFRHALACIWLQEGDMPAEIQRRLLDVTDGAISVLPAGSDQEPRAED